MCIRDRYQRRVHGNHKASSKMKISIIALLVFTCATLIHSETLPPAASITSKYKLESLYIQHDYERGFIADTANKPTVHTAANGFLYVTEIRFNNYYKNMQDFDHMFKFSFGDDAYFNDTPNGKILVLNVTGLVAKNFTTSITYDDKKAWDLQFKDSRNRGLRIIFHFPKTLQPPVDQIDQFYNCLGFNQHPEIETLIRKMIEVPNTCLLYTSPSPRDQA
eukprot:TRINITY_DN12815_c0_g1_i10.p1 TRINITY_DN12815_c0_g1~~TRINITY_DN12815_c0_g1_i10.p1  ORF type:complete len:220 (-),score=61.79 TRINITY_DN12815_c0_g1_i10:35-694(-)